MDNEDYYEEYGGLPSQNEIDQWQRDNEKWERARLHHHIARTYLNDYETSLLRITRQDVEKLVSIIEHSNKEEDVQQFLQAHPSILTHYLRGHPKYCVPKKSLGGMFIPDFVLADVSSLGLYWYIVELKNPKARMLSEDGHASKHLNDALQQIRDDRDWLKNNLNEARNLRQDKGLGLAGIEPELECLILIGRRRDLDENLLDTRRRMNREINGEIHTYDWLIEQANNELVRVENR